MIRRTVFGLVLVLAPSPAQQSPLRVLHVTPVSAILPSEPVTVTFDRPVVGPLGRVVDPQRVASLQPAVPVRFDWRDPSTLRLIPTEPWTPGQVVVLVIDTTLIALDGSRLTTPARIPIRVKGPAMRASVPALSATEHVRLPPDGRLQLLYSSEVDSLSLSRLRYEFSPSRECRSRIVTLRVDSQRPLTWNDPWPLNRVAGNDSVVRRMARIVELVPVSRVPDGCDGEVVVPSLDSLDAAEISYPISSAVAFAYSSLLCASIRDCAASASVTLTLTAPVQIDDARRAVRVDGAAPEFMLNPGPVVSEMTLRLNPMPGSVHRITMDSTLRDVAGRLITGPREMTLEVGDRHPRVSHPAGFITLPRQAAPFIRVSHVNVAQAELELVPLAHLSNLGAIFGAVPLERWNESGVVRRIVTLGGPRNEVRTTDVPLPELSSNTTRLLAVRLRLRQGAPGLTSSVLRIDGGRFTITSPDTMTTSSAVVQMTNLAVHARVDERRGAVMVTDLRRGLPARGAIVTMRDSSGAVVARARADSSGVAVISDGNGAGSVIRTLSLRGSRAPRLIDVEYGGDRALLPAAFDQRNSFDVAGGQNYLMRWHGPDRERRALVFTDRDLYRPGERVFLATVARDGTLDQLRIPGRGERFRWRVESYSNRDGQRVVHERDALITQFGTSSDSFDLAPRSSLGTHSAQLQREINGQWFTVSQAIFHVREYRAPEFAVSLTSDSSPRFIGDTLTFGVDGRYLYDAPMRGTAVRWHANIRDASPWELRIPSLPRGFHFGDPAASWEGRPAGAQWKALNGTDSLDAGGRVQIRVPSSPPLEGTKHVSFSVAVEDVNRQVVTSAHDAVLYGSEHYLAVREPVRGWWRLGTPVRIEVLAVRPDGSRSPGQTISARLIHARWVDSSGTGTRGRWIPDTLNTWSVVSADTAVSVSFTPRAGGYYTLQLFNRDRDGRPVESRVRRFAWGGASRFPVDGPPTQLALDADTASHALGTTASIRFDSPFESADAWVTIEREGLLRQFRRPVRRGPNDIGIEIRADMSPAALVGVVLLNRVPGVSDSLHHRVRMGMARIAVDSTVKRLTVAIAPMQREVAPGAEARMTLRVTDNRGRGTPAAVTVWAVDEGVLSMGDYSLPDPADALQQNLIRWMALASTLPSSIPLMEHRPSLIDLQTRDSASTLMRLRGSASLSMSVAAATAPPAEAMRARLAHTTDVRKDFRTTAFFRGMALTDDAGRGTITVKLPDNITTYRLFAVAVGLDDRAGSAESTFVATHPLVVRAALPRFVRPGDTFLAGAAIGTRDGRPRDVQAEAEGSGIALTSESTTTLKLGAGSAEARFSWTAREGDSARVTIAATDGTNSDAVRVAVPVKPDRFPLARSISGVVRDSMTLRITMPRNIDLARSRLTIRAGITPLTVIDEAIVYLAQYPYACTEQLLASARVMTATLALQRAGLPVKTSREFALGALQAAVDELVERQRADGAFGYWTSSSWSTPWLSTAVGLVLADAMDAGARVDLGVRDRLTHYLSRTLDSLPQFADTTSGTRLERRRTAANYLSERLAAAVYLRRAGPPRVTEERALLQRESLMAWEDRVLLAHTLHRAGDVVTAKSLLDRSWLAVGTAGLRVDLPDSIAGRGLFHSRVRPAARLVEATIAIDPTHPRLGALMERLVSRTAAVGRYWWNTQDYASAASAVVAFTRVVPRGDAVLTASMGTASPQSLALRTTGGAAVDSTIPLTALADMEGDSLVVRLRFAARNGPIFYGVTSHEVSAAPDTRPVNNGLVVERWYERFDNGEPAVEVREGELVRVRLRVTVPNVRDFVAVDDHLPAGLEAVDLSLRTSGTLGPFSTDESVQSQARRDREAAAGGFIGSWDSGWWSPWEHSEKRDDRVTWFARALPTGSYTATYVARATTAGRFIRPPSSAEEMYNAATSGRSEGGIFTVTARRP